MSRPFPTATARRASLAAPVLAVVLLPVVAPAGVIDTFETGGFSMSLSQPGTTGDAQVPGPGHCIATNRNVLAQHVAGSTGTMTCELVPLDGQNDAVEMTFPHGIGLVTLSYLGGPWDLTEGGTMNRITVGVGATDPGTTLFVRLADSDTFSHESIDISGAGNYQFPFSDFTVDVTAIEEIHVTWYGFEGQTASIREISTSNGPASSLFYRAWEPRTFTIACAAGARAGGSEEMLGWEWAVGWPSPQPLPGPVLEVTYLSAPGCVNVGFEATPGEGEDFGTMGMVTVDWQSASFSSAVFELQFTTDPAAEYSASLVSDPVLTFSEKAVVASHDIAISGASGVPDGVVHQELIVSVHPDQGENLTFGEAEVQTAWGPGVGCILQFALAGGPYDSGSPLLEMFTLASYKDDAGATGTPVAARRSGPPALVAIPTVTRGDVRFLLPAAADRAAVDVFDVSGRRVRTLGSSGGEARWDGSDAGGVRVPAGVYFGRTPDGGGAARVVLLR
jgi:hypothetical protein